MILLLGATVFDLFYTCWALSPNRRRATVDQLMANAVELEGKVHAGQTEQFIEAITCGRTVRQATKQIEDCL